MPAFDLVVLGDVNPDVMVSAGALAGAFGQREQIVDTGRVVLGGSAVITAVAAARLGARVALAWCIGLSGFGLRRSLGLAVACGSLSTRGLGGVGAPVTLGAALATAGALRYTLGRARAAPGRLRLGPGPPRRASSRGSGPG